ncbi:MAG: precorrin-6y C5,15-methyltransferase (decarboxylating) subunit CbiE [Bacilli bacterium]
MNDKRVFVVGVGDGGASDLGAQAIARIAASAILYGGERQLDFFPDYQGEKRVIQPPLKALVEEIRTDAQRADVVVLASGDPLYFGIGSTLVQQLGADWVDVLPHVSSIQLAFARAGESWQDARVVSLHGRPLQGLAQRLHGVRTAALFTDGVNTPSVIAAYLLQYGMTEYEVFVAEHLGSAEEKTGWYTLGNVVEREFAALNVVLLKRRTDAAAPMFTLGMDDGVFAQRKPDRGLITKREVRVLSLSELALRPGDVLWDIGACTGSVAIEALLATPDLRVFAIEKNAEDLENLRENQVKFRADFVAVCARAPDGLDAFPDPDAVFIGGSGGELTALLRHCAGRLREQGRIVVNAATIETLYHSYQTLRELGFSVSVTLVQTARSKPILSLTRLEGMNPVYLVTARRDQIEEDSAHDQ